MDFGCKESCEFCEWSVGKFFCNNSLIWNGDADKFVTFCILARAGFEEVWKKGRFFCVGVGCEGVLDLRSGHGEILQRN